MSKSHEESKDIFTECKKSTEKFFNEIDKSSPVYHQVTSNIQRNYLDAWKNVIDSSITLQQEFAAKIGMNIAVPEEMTKEIQNIIERSITAYQNQNKFVIDTTETSKKMFDVFSENGKIFASLNKNMMELMESGMKKYSQN